MNEKTEIEGNEFTVKYPPSLLFRGFISYFGFPFGDQKKY